MTEHRDLAAAAVIGLAALLAALLPSPGIVQALTGLPVVLFVSGYALVAALFPPGTLAGVERAVASIAAALALTVLVAVTLDALGLRLDAAASASALATVTLLATAVARIRRRDSTVHRDRRVTASWLEAGAVLLAVTAVAGFAFTLTDDPSSARVAGYTSLSGERSGSAVRVTVKSDELSATQYRVVIAPDSAAPLTESLRLRPGMGWDETVTVAPGTRAVRVMLYRGSESTPTRTLTLPA